MQGDRCVLNFYKKGKTARPTLSFASFLQSLLCITRDIVELSDIFLQR